MAKKGTPRGVEELPLDRLAAPQQFREPTFSHRGGVVQLFPGAVTEVISAACYVLKDPSGIFAVIAKLAKINSWQRVYSSPDVDRAVAHARKLALSPKLASVAGSRDRFEEQMQDLERSAPLPRVKRTNHPEAYSLIGRDGNG